MSDVTQWLAEIQDLKQQLQSARASEAAAHSSADNWRKRYELEAIQRRNEADDLRQTIELLQVQLADAEMPLLPEADEGLSATIQTLTKEQLQTKLLEVWSDRNRLLQDLKAEQEIHIQTRHNLTLALGDTVSMLTQLQKQA
jgi:ABC-type taurine transport system ATPase subunit